MSTKRDPDDAKMAQVGQESTTQIPPHVPTLAARQPASGRRSPAFVAGRPPPKSLRSRFHHRVKEAEPYGILFAAFALGLAVWAFLSDQRDRVDDRTFAAWQLLLHTAPGNSGKREALEYLNNEDGLFCTMRNCWPQWKRRSELMGIKLGAYYGEDDAGVLRGAVFLRGVQLPDAN